MYFMTYKNIDIITFYENQDSIRMKYTRSPFEEKSINS